MKEKTFSLQKILSLHKKKGRNLTFSYFCDEYCRKLLEHKPELKKIRVKISDTFSLFYFQKMQVVK